MSKLREKWASFYQRHPWSLPIVVVLIPWIPLFLFGILLSLDRLFPSPLERGARAYERGDYRTAEKLYRRVAQGDTNPNYIYWPTVQSKWGAALIRCGRPSEVSKAVNTPRGRNAKPEDLNVLGVAALALGSNESAVGWFRKASLLQPQMPVYHHNWSIALERIGDSAGARRERVFAVRKGGPRYRSLKEPVACEMDFRPLKPADYTLSAGTMGEKPEEGKRQ